MKAEHLRGGLYRISDQPQERDIETWQFEPGDLVICRMVELESGPVLTAVGKVNDDT